MSEQKTYSTRTMSIVVLPDGEPSFSEMATLIEITDEAGGEFVQVTQQIGKIAINPEEWPELRKAINLMIRECRDLP